MKFWCEFKGAFSKFLPAFVVDKFLLTLLKLRVKFKPYPRCNALFSLPCLKSK